ncbi:MAG: DsbA family protein [Patescibacteria group bacterium]|mgnify:FL=1
MDQQKKFESEIFEKEGASQTENPYSVPLAIVIAGAIIAGAIFYSSGRSSSAPVGDNKKDAIEKNQPQGGSGSLDAMKPVSAIDHILGNPDAPIKIVEFSDTECPFCKRFHPTMQTAIEEYGKNGEVAWVYRHFPIDSLHPIKARKEAEATECANELGGNAKFWAYLDRLFEITPSNNQLDLGQLPEIAVYVGLDRARFLQCLDSGKYAEHVADDLADGGNTGINGTPFSIVIAQNGKKFPLNGAQPYSAVKALIELARKEK